jgi:hypothetical protein
MEKVRSHGILSGFTPSRRFIQALSLMVKAVSEETLKTASPTWKLKGELTETVDLSPATFI